MPFLQFGAGSVLRATGAILLLGLCVSCSRSDSTAGVENLWRSPSFSVQEGVTTDADVLEALGPPSQIINLGDKTVFYYLKEAFRSDRLLLIIYNKTKRTTSYDRAVFFFTPDGVLEKASFSKNALPED
ncbi:hypothetical protein KHP62_04955 [Rhodobacteraceae bacterium NNCM2]|nr:hypothetical protein [Coraliihabitans acroporae]